MRTRAIVNLHSSGGRTGANWPAMEERLRGAVGPVDAVFTKGSLDATRLTREALREGVTQIVAVGGDGTVNEVVNGFFEEGALIKPQATLSMLMSGTGGDFRKTFRLPASLPEQVERIARGDARPIDIGRLAFIDHDGRPAIRYFNNIASFGLSGAADRAVNELTWAKRLPGKYAFQWGIFKTLVRYKNQAVRVRVDDGFDRILNVSTAAVCNGQYFGGGMQMAPHASVEDGLFDVIILADTTLIEMLRGTGKIYKGEHLGHEKIVALRGKKIVAEPVHESEHVLLDVDGEAPGRLPASFEILPRILNFKC